VAEAPPFFLFGGPVVFIGGAFAFFGGPIAEFAAARDHMARSVKRDCWRSSGPATNK